MEPIEDWTPDWFVEFSPRHLMPDPIQPQTDLLLLFRDYATSQQAANFHPISDGHYSSQQSAYELPVEYIQNAIRMVLEDLELSIAENISASCSAAVHDECKISEDNSSSVDSMSDSEHDSDAAAHADSSLDADCSSSREQASHHDLAPLCSQTNSAFQMPVVEEWLVDTVAANINSSRWPSLRKSSSKSSLIESKPFSRKSTSFENKPFSQERLEQIQSDVPDIGTHCGSDIDSQSFCLLQHLSASDSHRQPDNTRVKRQSSNSKAHCPRQTSQGKNKKLNNSCKKSHANSWQVQNVSKRCSLFEYKEKILNQHIPDHRGYILQQAYCHIRDRWRLNFVRHMRGDNFAAVRAILYQALVNNFLQDSVIGRFQQSCKKLRIFRDERNEFLHCWNFANRIPYDRGREVEVLSDCLDELHSVIETMSCVPDRCDREEYLMYLLNYNPDIDIRLLESVKFLMMERALCVYRQVEWRKQYCYPQAAHFWMFMSLCPVQLFQQRINPLGDSVKADEMELQLLGYALNIQIEIIRPSMFGSCEFVTRYLCEGMRSCGNLCLVIEEDEEYCVLTE